MPERQQVELSRNKVEEILTHDTRTAVDMKKTKGKIDEYYSVSKTVEDTLFINQVLKNADAEELHLTAYERDHLRTINSRNKAHILLNQQKFTGDSGLMQNVKETVGRLETLLADENALDHRLDEVADAFRNAIKACQTYCEKKNPWFTKGKVRKLMVERRLDSLYAEFDRFLNAREALEEGIISKPQRPMDLLDMASIIKERKDAARDAMTELVQEEKVVEEQKQEEQQEQKQEEKKVVEEKQEKVIVEEQQEQKQEEKADEEQKRKEAIKESMEKKLVDIRIPSQSEKDAANKALEQKKKSLLGKVKEPDEHIKVQVLKDNQYFKDRLQNFDDYHVRNPHYVYYDEQSKSRLHPYEDLWDKWKPVYQNADLGQNLSAKTFDEIKRIIIEVQGRTQRLDERNTSDKLINYMNETFEKIAKDCPLMSPKEMDALLKKLSGSDIEQKKAVMALQKYIEDIKKWDKDIHSMEDYEKNDFKGELKDICTNIEEILEEQEKLNPVIFAMTEEEVEAIQEIKDQVEDVRLKQERKKKEEADRAELEALKKEQEELEAELKANEKKLADMDKEVAEDEAKADKMKKKIDQKKEQLQKEAEELEKERKELEGQLLKNKWKIEGMDKEIAEDEAKASEMKKDLDAKQRIFSERERTKKIEEDNKKILKENIKIDMESDTKLDAEYGKLKKDANSHTGNNGLMKPVSAHTKYLGDQMARVVIPIFSDNGTTWDTLMAICRIGAYAELMYEEYDSESSIIKMRKLLIDELGGAGDIDPYASWGHNKPTLEVLKKCKCKFTKDGRVKLSEGTKKQLAYLYKKLSAEERKIMETGSDFLSKYGNIMPIQSMEAEQWMCLHYNTEEINKIVKKNPDLIG